MVFLLSNECDAIAYSCLQRSKFVVAISPLLSSVILILLMYLENPGFLESIITFVIFLVVICVPFGLFIPLKIIRDFSQTTSEYMVLDSISVRNNLGIITMFCGSELGLSILIPGLSINFAMIPRIIIACIVGALASYSLYRFIVEPAKKLDEYTLIPNVRNGDVAKVVSDFLDAILGMSIVPTSLHRTFYLKLELYEDTIMRMARYEKSIWDLYNALLDALGGRSAMVATSKEEIREILEGTEREKLLGIVVVMVMLIVLGAFLYAMIVLGMELHPEAFLGLLFALLAFLLYLEYKRREKLEKYFKHIRIELDQKRYLTIMEKALDIIEKIFETIEKQTGRKAYIANTTRSFIVELKEGLAKAKTMQEQQTAATTYV